MDTDYVELYRPPDVQALALIKLHLDAQGIRYYVADENFGSLLPVTTLGEMRLMVNRQDAERCAEILREQLGIEVPSLP
jgi:flagellar biosynthesis/type III secretory pathway M-ring protein FliF/YscJ